MAEDMLTFRKFRDAEIAEDVSQHLTDAGILFRLADDRKIFDPTFANNPMQDETRIEISPADFPKADKALANYYRSQLDGIEKDYYLFEFSDWELYEILAKPDEWGELDYQLAQKILSDRGKPIDNERIAALKNKRDAQLAKPERSQAGLVIAGYFFALFGSFIGMVIGFILTGSKKTLPNGESVFIYSPQDRLNGKIILGVALIVLIIALFYGRVIGEQIMRLL